MERKGCDESGDLSNPIKKGESVGLALGVSEIYSAALPRVFELFFFIRFFFFGIGPQTKQENMVSRVVGDDVTT